MKRRPINDYSEDSRAEMHRMLDIILDMKLSGVIAAKQFNGGYIYKSFGDLRSVKALVSWLYKVLAIEEKEEE